MVAVTFLCLFGVFALFKNNLLVSVIIPTCNRANLLSRALNSVLNQTYSNIEIIVIDDNSLDDTSQIVEQFARRTTIPIKYYKNETTMGACFARNKGISMAKGFYLTGLDDDDEFTPVRIQEFINNFDDKYSFISANITVYSKAGKHRLFSKSGLCTIDDLLWSNCIGNQIFTLTNRVKAVNGFDNTLTSAQDYDLWIRLVLKYGTALRLPISTYNLYTDHDKPRITTSKNKIDGMIVFYEKHKHLMNKFQSNLYKFKINYWSKNKRLSLKIFHGVNIFYLFLSLLRRA